MRQHREYADLLIHHGKIPGPETRSEYYTPPLFYALAGAATLVGEHVHAGDPHKLGQLLNWFVLLATAGRALAARTRALSAAPWAAALRARVLLLLTGRPARRRDVPPRAAVDAASAVALLLAARMLGRRDYRWQLAVATGVALGLGQLVRAFSLWTFAAVVIAFVVARAWRPLA